MSTSGNDPLLRPSLGSLTPHLVAPYCYTAEEAFCGPYNNLSGLTQRRQALIPAELARKSMYIADDTETSPRQLTPASPPSVPAATAVVAGMDALLCDSYADTPNSRLTSFKGGSTRRLHALSATCVYGNYGPDSNLCATDPFAMPLCKISPAAVAPVMTLSPTMGIRLSKKLSLSLSPGMHSPPPPPPSSCPGTHLGHTKRHSIPMKLLTSPPAFPPRQQHYPTSRTYSGDTKNEGSWCAWDSHSNRHSYSVASTADTAIPSGAESEDAALKASYSTGSTLYRCGRYCGRLNDPNGLQISRIDGDAGGLVEIDSCNCGDPEYVKQFEYTHPQIERLAQELMPYYGPVIDGIMRPNFAAADFAAATTQSAPLRNTEHPSWSRNSPDPRPGAIRPSDDSRAWDGQQQYQQDSERQKLTLQLRAAETKVAFLTEYIDTLSDVVRSLKAHSDSLSMSLDRVNLRNQQLVEILINNGVVRRRSSHIHRAMLHRGHPSHRYSTNNFAAKSAPNTPRPTAMAAGPHNLSPSRSQSARLERELHGLSPLPSHIKTSRMCALESLRSARASRETLDILTGAYSNDLIDSPALNTAGLTKSRTQKEWVERCTRRIGGVSSDWSLFQRKWQDWTTPLRLAGIETVASKQHLDIIYRAIASQLKTAGYALRSAHQLITHLLSLSKQSPKSSPSADPASDV